VWWCDARTVAGCDCPPAKWRDGAIARSTSGSVVPLRAMLRTNSIAALRLRADHSPGHEVRWGVTDRRRVRPFRFSA